MRPDTPQQYEYILVEDITGDADHFLYIKPWTQFFDLKDRKDIPVFLPFVHLSAEASSPNL
jgi:hypothetical protein